VHHEQTALAAAIPSLSAVPMLVVDESGTEDEIGLDRDTLRLLMHIDGRRTVADLARERGLMRTLKQLAKLSQLKLARIEAANAPSPTTPARADWPPQASYPNQAPAHPQSQAQDEPQAEAEPQAPEQAAQPGQRSTSTWARWHRGSS
jgi:hypothetical protein